MRKKSEYVMGHIVDNEKERTRTLDVDERGVVDHVCAPSMKDVWCIILIVRLLILYLKLLCYC